MSEVQVLYCTGGKTITNASPFVVTPRYPRLTAEQFVRQRQQVLASDRLPSWFPEEYRDRGGNGGAYRPGGRPAVSRF